MKKLVCKDILKKCSVKKLWIKWVQERHKETDCMKKCVCNDILTNLWNRGSPGTHRKIFKIRCEVPFLNLTGKCELPVVARLEWSPCMTINFNVMSDVSVWVSSQSQRRVPGSVCCRTYAWGLSPIPLSVQYSYSCSSNCTTSLCYSAH